MKTGDLVKMKKKMWWILKGNRYKMYTEEALLVLETAHNAVKLIYPDGSVKTDLKENYSVVSPGNIISP